MLLNLHVKNMALIKEAEVDFSSGLNILTGETGAGKSIIIGSVNIALGTGAFRDYVPEGTDDALVELVFETESEKAFLLLEQAGIQAQDHQIVLARKYHNGKSISRVNGESVPLKFVRELAGTLIDIHGQHEHQSLLYPAYHLQLLDRWCAAQLKDLPEKCREAYQEWTGYKKELDGALTDEKERAKQADLLAYEIDEIDKAALRPGEDEQLEQEYRRMENAQRITAALQEVMQFTSSEAGAGDMVSRAARAMANVSSFDPALEELSNELAQVEDMLGGFGRDLAGYLDDFSYDERTFYEITKRLDLINHLKSKYGSDIEEILEYRDEQQKKLDTLTDYEGYLENLRSSCKRAFEKLSGIAEEISAIRKKGARVLEGKIIEALLDLNFADVRFSIDFKENKEPGAGGKDSICFMISMNPGIPLRPLQDTASGGELSRIMLALKAVMADQDESGTLIFDEIDSGISGRTAQKVSEKMAVIAAGHQVICITHLAQIAAMANRHFVIEKKVSNDAAQTQIRQINEEETIEELARILGGAKITDTVLQSAKEMRKLALELKEKS